MAGYMGRGCGDASRALLFCTVFPSRQRMHGAQSGAIADSNRANAPFLTNVPDNVTLQILSTFPTFILQQIQNAIAVRRIVPRGVDRTDLHWTLLGFAEDTPEQRLIRLKQATLVGPAGYISMEDGCVGGFVQRGIAGAADDASPVIRASS
jgi:hypothetical protein